MDLRSVFGINGGWNFTSLPLADRSRLVKNLRALSTSAPAPKMRVGLSVSRRGTCDRGIWTKPLAFAADAGELMGFALGFRCLFVGQGGWRVTGSRVWGARSWDHPCRPSPRLNPAILLDPPLHSRRCLRPLRRGRASSRGHGLDSCNRWPNHSPGIAFGESWVKAPFAIEFPL